MTSVSVINNNTTITVNDTGQTIEVVSSGATILNTAITTLDGLNDTNFSSLTDGDLVVWDSASARFINLANSGGGDYLPLAGGTLTGDLIGEGHAAFGGDGAIQPFSIIHAAETITATGHSQLMPAMTLEIDSIGGAFYNAIPVGIDVYLGVDAQYGQSFGFQAKTTLKGTVSFAKPSYAAGFGASFNDTVVSVGASQLSCYRAQVSHLNYGVIDGVIGFDLDNLVAGTASVGICAGIRVAKQIGATVNAGIMMGGDGLGADITFGLGRDANIYYDGNDLIVNPKITGSGGLRIQGDLLVDGSAIEPNSTNGVMIGSTASKKWGFWGATPIIQPTAIADTNAESGAAGRVEDELNLVKQLLRDTGLMAS